MGAVPPRAGASNATNAYMTGIIFLFGGQGKKLSNDLHRLDTESGVFTELSPKGPLPQPRRGMSLTYDGDDQLVCFGGTNATTMDNMLSVYSLQRNEWSQPTQVWCAL